jgi:hypothetical protein
MCFIVYLFDVININIFIYIFVQTVGTLTENAPRIAFFGGTEVVLAS